MKLSRPGAHTFHVEVAGIDIHGIWILVRGKECFLPHEDYPWFRKARVEDVMNVELHHGVHLHWPALDVDLSLDSLDSPHKYLLVAEG
jgi:hypothetical protein